MGPAAGSITPSSPAHRRHDENQPDAWQPEPAPPAARSPIRRKSCRLQQPDDLAEKRQLDACIDAQNSTANLDFDRPAADSGAALRHDRHKIRQGGTGRGERAGSQFPTPHVKLIAMQPVAQRNRARDRPRRQALRDNRHLLCRTPASPLRRSRQNLNPPETVPINWQITWQTSLPTSPERGRIIRSLSAPARRGQRSAFDTLTALAPEIRAAA